MLHSPRSWQDQLHGPSEYSEDEIKPDRISVTFFSQVKIQKMRSNLEEKLMRRMTTVHRRAEEWRATAQAQHLQQLKRAAEQVRRAKATSHHHHHHHHLAGSNASCGCFPCNGSSNIISGNLLNYY